MMRPPPARYLTAAALMLAALTVTGCGEDDPAAVCADVDALKASVADVTSVTLTPGALAELQDGLSQVQADLNKVVDDAQDEFASEIDAVEQASTSVSDSLEAAVTSPSAPAIAEVGAAVRALGTSLSALEDAVRSTC